MKNKDRSGFLRKQALDTLNPLLPKMRGKWRGRGVVGAFGRCHNRVNYQPVTDPMFNHALRPAHIARELARFAEVALCVGPLKV